jgi:hypothetical protein
MIVMMFFGFFLIAPKLVFRFLCSKAKGGSSVHKTVHKRLVIAFV